MRATNAVDVSEAGESTVDPPSKPVSTEIPANPKPISARKRATNRANAQESTGPKSDAGKKRSAMNAVRHGLAARASLLPGEDPDELETFAAEMDADLRPRGAAQRELVGRIVSFRAGLAE